MKRGTFLILCLEGAVLSFNVAASAALVPSIAADFNVPQFIAGRIIWFYMLPYGLAALFYGPLVRAFDAKKIELFCIFFFALANLSAGISRSIPALFASRFFMGLFGASVIPLGLILIARHIDRQNRGRFVGIFFGATFAASLLGLFLSGIIPWRGIFIIPAICGFLLCVPIYLFLPNFLPGREGFQMHYLAALKNRTTRSIFIYIFFISLLYHGIQQWLGVYFSARFSLSQFLISMLITLTSLSGIIGEFSGGRLADFLGRLGAVQIGISLMVLSVFLLMLKISLAALAVIMVLWGIGWAFNHAGISTLLTDFPEEFLYEAASLNSSLRFLAGGLGVAAGGFFIQKSFDLYLLAFGWSLILLAISTKNIFRVRMKGA